MTSSPTSHIIVGVSGGVDSSVAAYLLKKAGHHVEAVFMKNWEEEDTESYCHAAIDLKDAEAVCDQLKINLRVVNFSDEYWQQVFVYFLTEHQAGRTPNPDILCNKEIKFKAFLNYAKQQGADYIATGHYARVEKNGDATILSKSMDSEKDQTYFLYALSENQLAQAYFPIGDLTKQTVRAIAKELGFKTHDKKDSTGICFIGERRFKAFLNEYLPTKCGKIETLEGEVVGEHDGVMFYTIGQRQGLKIGGQRNKAELPWYVVDKDLKRNVLIVVQGKTHPALFKCDLHLEQIHWINHAPRLPTHLKAKIRYRQKEQKCLVTPLSTHGFHVQFELPQRAVTPGQSIVFYKDDICLGGGVIG